jgi:hypothetical protein
VTAWTLDALGGQIMKVSGDHRTPGQRGEEIMPTEIEIIRATLVDLGQTAARLSEALRSYAEAVSAPDTRALGDVPDKCENCGHPEHGHAVHIELPGALLDCPSCPCAAELRELSGEDDPAVPDAVRLTVCPDCFWSPDSVRPGHVWVWGGQAYRCPGR